MATAGTRSSGLVDVTCACCLVGSMVVARGGVEPPTYRFSGGRSYQLSYLAAPDAEIRPAEVYRRHRNRDRRDERSDRLSCRWV